MSPKCWKPPRRCNPGRGAKLSTTGDGAPVKHRRRWGDDACNAPSLRRWRKFTIRGGGVGLEALLGEDRHRSAESDRDRRWLLCPGKRLVTRLSMRLNASARQTAALTLCCHRALAADIFFTLIQPLRSRREGVPKIFEFFCPGFNRSCGKEQADAMAHLPGVWLGNKVLNIHGRNQNCRNGSYNLRSLPAVRCITGICRKRFG